MEGVIGPMGEPEDTVAGELEVAGLLLVTVVPTVVTMDDVVVTVLSV